MIRTIARGNMLGVLPSVGTALVNVHGYVTNDKIAPYE
jgi:hypothetical protein